MINNVDELITCLKRNECIVSCIWSEKDEKYERYAFESIENYEGFIELGNGEVSFVMDEAELIVEFPIDKKKFMEINAFINVYDMDSIKDEVYVDHNGDIYWGEREYTEEVNESVEDVSDCPADDEIATTDPKEFQLRLDVISRLFDVYSQLDFNKLCDLINYMGGIKYTEANIDGINAKDYFENCEEIDVNELQDYVHTLCKACYKRWLSEHNDPEENDTEYTQNNILVSISKDGESVGLDFIPIAVCNEA